MARFICWNIAESMLKRIASVLVYVNIMTRVPPEMPSQALPPAMKTAVRPIMSTMRVLVTAPVRTVRRMRAESAWRTSSLARRKTSCS